MSSIRFLTPVVSIAMLTLAAALPWGIPTADRFVLPLLPVVAIFYWTLDQDAWLPEWAIFAAGLTLDVLTQGPLGYWALVYLFAHVVAVLVSRFTVEGVFRRIALLASAIVLATGFAWMLASLYFLEILDAEPYARGAIFAILSVSLITLGLGIFKVASRPGGAVRLTRGAE